MKLTICLIALFSSAAMAGAVKKKPTIAQTFKNTECELTSTCDLKEFTLATYDYKVMIEGSYSYGTSATMSYKTDEVDNLEKYAVVQYIRGCVFDSSLVDGKIVKGSHTVRKSFDQVIPFFHKTWEIDSLDKDPVYNSIPEGRHQAYRWNRKQGSTDKKTQVYVLNERPAHPELYVTDIPAGAFKVTKEAKNVSLEFKSCIYKTEDIPLETTPGDINFAKPLKCFDWSSSYIYNHKSKLYESKKEIDSYCLQ